MSSEPQKSEYKARGVGSSSIRRRRRRSNSTKLLPEKERKRNGDNGPESETGVERLKALDTSIESLSPAG